MEVPLVVLESKSCSLRQTNSEKARAMSLRGDLSKGQCAKREALISR